MIYFIQDTVQGYIKIGKTRETRLEARIRALQTSMPNVLVCIGVIANDDNEKKYHDKFIDAHYRGEWYSPFSYLLDFIKSLPYDPYIGVRGDRDSKEIMHAPLDAVSIEQRHILYRQQQSDIKRLELFQRESVLVHNFGEYKKLWLKYKDLSISSRSVAASRMALDVHIR
jgi:hypothetical protein